jgi:hypothetical protein
MVLQVRTDIESGGHAASNLSLGVTSWWEHRKKVSNPLGGIQSRRRLKRVRAESVS